ncbi:hypothetical protein T484DRAFT_1988478, partial [Baffinella frigidus]
GGLEVTYTGGEIDIDGQVSVASRRSLTNCTGDVSVRIARVGEPLASACSCPVSCGPTAACTINASGLWTTVVVPAGMCDGNVTRNGNAPGSNVPLAAILIPAILCPFVLLVLGLVAWRLQVNKGAANDLKGPQLSACVVGSVPLPPSFPTYAPSAASTPLPQWPPQHPPGSMPQYAPRAALPEQTSYSLPVFTPQPSAYFAPSSQGGWAPNHQGQA